MTGISNKGAGGIISEIAAVIVQNKAYLSEIDGMIGDGDHGVNMAKGFSRAAERVDPDGTLSDAMAILSEVLMGEIGGSMGPLYGTMFAEMADDLGDAGQIDAASFASMIRAGLTGVQDIGSADLGDKTMLDTLIPAVAAFEAGCDDFPAALAAMKAAAETGRDSTIDMVAKIGRSARLGERSRGVLDAGATSCALILGGFADGITRRL